MAKGIVIAALSLLLQGAAPPALPPSPESPDGSTVCDNVPETPASPEPAFFPTTGRTFTLPPAENAEVLPCPNMPPPPVRPAAPNIFGSVALPIKSTALNWRWDQARAAMPVGAAVPWESIVARVRQLDDREKLTFVNSWVNNTIRFTEDKDRDHWASAAETLRNGAGDCEDFAIAKLTLLQEAGLPTDYLFLIVVRDTLRNADHAVLGARLASEMPDGEMLVLDSRTDRILPSGMITDYQPIFSFGGDFAWTHGYAKRALSLPGK